MSYLVKHARATRRMARRKPRKAMGDWFTDLVGNTIGGSAGDTLIANQQLVDQQNAGASGWAQFFGGVYSIPPVAVQDVIDVEAGTATNVCIDQANASQASLNSVIGVNGGGLAQNWNPSGFYSPDQLHQIVTQTMTLVQQAGTDLMSAMAGDANSNDQSNYQMMLDDVNRVLTGNGIKGAIATNGQQYLQIEQQARSSNTAVINAPDLKPWVIGGLMAVSNAYTTIYTLNCQTPAWINIMDKIIAAVTALVNFVMGVIGVAIKVGESILNAPTVAANAFDILKWVAIAGVAWWGYNQYKGR